MLLDDLNNALGLDRQYLQLLARTANHRYKTYEIPKRSGRGNREINHPARELKLVQRWLVDNSFSILPIHDCVFSYRKGLGIKKLALRLRRGQYLLRMDFEDFFPSITASNITKYLRGVEKFEHSESDLKFVANIVCRNRALTIGAPSSPILSNAILFGLDDALHQLAAARNVVYCRYADDIYFSSNKRDILGEVESRVSHKVAKYKGVSLRINKSKTQHSSRKQRRAAVGLILTPRGAVSIGRERKRMIRSLVYKYSNGDLEDMEIRSLRGHLSYANSIEPKFISRLRAKYGKALIFELFR